MKKSNDPHQTNRDLIMELTQETDNPETLRFVYSYLMAHKQKVQKLKEEVGKQYVVK